MDDGSISRERGPAYESELKCTIEGKAFTNGREVKDYECVFMSYPGESINI